MKNRYENDGIDIKPKKKLLSKGEEVELSRKVRRYIEIRNEIDGNKYLLKGEIKKEYEEGFKARQLMIESNIRLVISIASNFKNRGIPFQDLIQEGTIGLINGIERFDESYQCKVSTYVSFWIKQALVKTISDNGKLIRLPIHILSLYNKIKSSTKYLTQKLNRLPTNNELLEELNNTQDLNLSLYKLDSIRLNFNSYISLDIKVNKNKEYKDTTTLADIIDSNDPFTKPDSFKEVYRTILKEDILNVLNKLEPPQGAIIWYKFGLDDDVNYNGRSLEEVSNIIGLPREKIRLLETKAFRTLKTEPFYKYLIDYAMEL